MCHIIGSGASARIVEELFCKRVVLIKKYVGSDRDLQLRVLYALQVVLAKLQHPPGELHLHYSYVCQVYYSGKFRGIDLETSILLMTPW